jgi:hypothetical protein
MSLTLSDLGMTPTTKNINDAFHHEYRDKEKGSQLVVFNNLTYGKYGYTDLDAVQEFFGKYLILVEVKTNDAELNRGQKLFISNTINRWVEINEAYRLFWSVMSLVEETTNLNGLELLDKAYDVDNTLDTSLFKLPPNKKAIGVRVSHNISAPNDIELGDCVVREIYLDGNWVEMPETPLYKDFYWDLILNKWKISKK